VPVTPTSSPEAGDGVDLDGAVERGASPTREIVVVTDSTCCLPADVIAEHGLVVVPLQVVIGSDSHDEGSPAATPTRVAEALREHRAVSTSRPAPALLRRIYDEAAAGGASAVVSVHLSGDMSGTLEAAQLAAQQASLPVVCVDTRQVGAATGYAAVAAAEAVAAGADPREAALAARRRADASASYFYVDTLEHLRRGGRIGSAAALLGGALAVKPLLSIDDGVVTTREKVRTSAKAIARLAELTVAAAETSEGPIDLCVAHLAAQERADTLAAELADRLAHRLGDRFVWSTELGAVLGAHVGPGMLAACVAPRV